MRNFRIILLVLLLGASVSIRAEKKPVIQTIYAFGFSVSFTDSVAFLTDVMQVDSATILSNGFLADRTLYGLQLENYVLGKCRVANSTNAIFFSTKKTTIDKKYNKLNRMYQHSDHLDLIYVGEDEFKFKAVEHIEPTIYEIDESVTETDSSRGKAAKSKKKGK